MSLPDRDVMLCRDCCCGSRSKHPSTDHAVQREALLAVSDTDRVRVRVVDCLDQCERSNVVLVRDFTAGRRPQDTWLGGVLEPDVTDQVVEWVQVGGALPEGLEPHRFGRAPRGRGLSG